MFVLSYVFREPCNNASNKLDYKYLGVIFTYSGNFMENGEKLAKAGGRALGKIISSIHNNKDHTRN